MDKNHLDAVKFGRDVPSREAGNVCDAGSIDTFQVEQDNLSVYRLEFPDQPRQPLQRKMPVSNGFSVAAITGNINLVDAHQVSRLHTAVIEDMRCRHVMRYAVDPCAKEQRASNF